jgi:hypothetical protein
MEVLYTWRDKDGSLCRIIDKDGELIAQNEYESLPRQGRKPAVMEWGELTCCPMVCEQILRMADSVDANSELAATDHTGRGFAKINFTDRYGVDCSIQKSSLATENAIWIGVEDANPEVMASEAVEVGVLTEQTTGWVPYPVPSNVLIHTRMHLTQDLAAKVLAILQFFVENGELPEEGDVMPEESVRDTLLRFADGVPAEEHQKVLDPLFIPNLRKHLIEKGRLEDTIEHPLFKAFIEALHSVYRNVGGDNFFAMECSFNRHPEDEDDPDQSFQWYDVIIQRSGKETCVAQLARLKGEIAELQAKLKKASKPSKPKTKST